jgi:hypothetical protein
VSEADTRRFASSDEREESSTAMNVRRILDQSVEGPANTEPTAIREHADPDYDHVPVDGRR